MDELIEQFCTVTEASPETARHFLEATNSDFDTAIELFFTKNSTAEEASTSGINSSDKNGDIIRKPIPQKTETLIQESFQSSYATSRRRTSNSVFDKFRDFEAESIARAKTLKPTANKNEGAASSSVSSKTTEDTKRKTLETLFRPPVEIMHRGSFESAKDDALNQKRWLLVNVQKSEEFACQALNRDVWNHAMVRDLVQNNFVLWQIYHDSADGRRFITYYRVENFPFVGVVDPRTGELLMAFRVLPDAASFCDAAVCFLENHSDDLSDSTRHNNNEVNCTEDINSNIDVKSKRKRKIVDVEGKCSNGKSIAKSTSPCSTSSKFSKIDLSDNGSVDNDVAESHPNPNINTSRSSCAPALENWRDFVATSGEEIQVLFRLVNGEKHLLKLPVLSRLKALLLYAAKELNLTVEKYDFLLNFPTRILNKEDPNATLQQLRFNKQELIYVEER